MTAEKRAVAEVHELSFSYEQIPVLDHLSFSLGEGELIAVLGANGAGKSTLFRCMLGLLRTYSGHVLIDGKDITTMSRRELASRVAYIPQAETPVFNYTVFDMVLMGATGTLSPLERPGAEQVERAQEALRTLGVEKLADRGVQEISGGERQLVYLARALAQDSHLLIMDEPTANLDFGNQQMVLQYVKSLAGRGYTVVMSTHNPEHALLYAEKVLIIKDHMLYAYGDTAETLNEKLIGDIYGLEVALVTVERGGQVLRSCLPVPPAVSGHEEDAK